MEIEIWESYDRKNAGKEKKNLMTFPFGAKMRQNLSPLWFFFFCEKYFMNKLLV